MMAGTVKFSPANLLHAGVQREQAVLAVDGAQDAPLALGTLRSRIDGSPGMASKFRCSSHEMMTAPGIDGSRAPGALLEVGDELIDLLPDDLALIRLLTRGNAALQQVPPHLGLPVRLPRTPDPLPCSLAHTSNRTSLSMSLAVREA